FYKSSIVVVSWKVAGELMSFFFFQAEDGIRDGHVTGVQTCALPISARRGSSARRGGPRATARRAARRRRGAGARGTRARRRASRSEERRVGKECRARRAPAR